MSSLQSVAPIAATALYTSLYKATADLSYPWQASYLFCSVGFVTIGEKLLYKFLVIQAYFTDKDVL